MYHNQSAVLKIINVSQQYVWKMQEEQRENGWRKSRNKEKRQQESSRKIIVNFQ